MDGELWETKEKEDEEEEEDDDEIKESDKQSKFITDKPCRNMSLCFTNGQQIRHKIGINKIWVGVYDSSKNQIIHNNKFYKTPSGFAENHYSIDRPDRINAANGWKECECEVNGEWISIYNLKSIT